MKRTIVLAHLIALILPFEGYNLSAQGLYLHLYPGYGLKSSPSYVQGFQNIRVTDQVITINQYNVSLGEGLTFGGSLGYMLNESIGADLGINYLIGSKYAAYSNGITDEYQIKEDVMINSRMFRVNPSIVISSRAGSATPYARVGMVMGWGRIYNVNSSELFRSGSITTVDYNLKLYGGVALGVSAAAGLHYALSEDISLFSEVMIISMSYAPTKGEVIEYKVNGLDMISRLRAFETNYEYVSSLTLDANERVDVNKPTKELAQKFPYGSVGLNIGVRIGI